jgi:hypothetical protein
LSHSITNNKKLETHTSQIISIIIFDDLHPVTVLLEKGFSGTSDVIYP